MAIPMASTMAPAILMPVLSRSAPARATPTAIPSGRLWRVTARTSMVVFRKSAFIPSGFAFSIWRWGTRLSSNSRKPTPARKPAAAGSQAFPPCSSDISMAGSKSDQREAAIITPEANPMRSFPSHGFMSFFMKNTMAAPRDVPQKGIDIIINSFIPLLSACFGTHALA